MNITSGFAALGVPNDLCRHLAEAGITEPFEIQAAVIPDALAGHDVLGRAPTGSGKTLAFGLPVVARLTAAAPRRPTGLILAPTRELAEQIANELRPIAQRRGRRVAAIYGGVGYGPQRQALATAALVVACPGRLEDLLQMGALSLDAVEHVVVDEADRMADVGFMPAVRRLLAACPAERQVQLFSATLDEAVQQVVDEFLRAPRRHEVGPAGPDVHAARHVFWSTERTERVRHTAEAIRRLGPTMVFTRTRHGADRLARQLDKLGVAAASIHGGRSQAQRSQALRSFARGEVQTLIATDVAARGVHVDGVAGVVHYDPPEDAAAYVHRSGRTARAGATGTVVSLVEHGRSGSVRRLLQPIGLGADVTDVDHDALGEPVAPTVRAETLSTPAPAADEPPAPRSRQAARPRREERRARRDEQAERTQRGARQEPARRVPATRGHAAGRVAGAARPERRDRRASRSTGRRHGVVSFANTARGFAFIDGGDGADLFAHHTKVPHWPLATGQRVEFATAPGRKGTEAVDVRVVGAH